MKAKATHYGHCQVCGRRQKLPKGRLSKHGYTVQWNMFQGTCFGAHELPFEQDISLIEQAIKRAELSIKHIQENIIDIKNDTTTIYINNYYGYRSHPNGKGGYIYETYKVTDLVKDESNERLVRYHAIPQLTPNETRLNNMNEAFVVFEDGSVDNKVHEINERYIGTLVKRIASFQQYIEWQQDRIKDWKPSELEPVEK